MVRRTATDADLLDWCDRRGGTPNQNRGVTRCSLGNSGYISRDRDTGEVSVTAQIRNLGEEKAVAAMTFRGDDLADLQYDTKTGKLVLDGEVEL